MFSRRGCLTLLTALVMAACQSAGDDHKPSQKANGTRSSASAKAEPDADVPGQTDAGKPERGAIASESDAELISDAGLESGPDMDASDARAPSAVMDAQAMLDAGDREADATLDAMDAMDASPGHDSGTHDGHDEHDAGLQDAASAQDAPSPAPEHDAQVPPQPATGLPDVKFKLDAVVPAGTETLKCIYGAFPTNRGVIAVPSAESHFTPGSHHLLAYRSDLKSIPVGQTGVWDCSDGSWVLHQRGSYYEAQQPDAHRELPAGVAHEFQPGEVIILQAHYVNTKNVELSAHVELTLHTIDVGEVEQEAGSLIFSDSNILVPPHSRARVTMTCPIARDINPALLWSHMHKRGVHFEATTDDESAADVLGMLYESNDWSEPQPREFPSEGVVLHAGSHITFSCDFENDGNDTFVYGNSAEDNEMCILHGMYWPRMPSNAEQCFGGVTSVAQL